MSNAFSDKSKLLQLIYTLGGVFDPKEDIGKRGCLFFTSFNAAKTSPANTLFYNQATEFESLAGRMKDTIDNTISDHLLMPTIRDGVKYYCFKSNLEKAIVAQYRNKFPFYALLFWLYRFIDFEELSLKVLKMLFIHDFNISPEQITELFDLTPIQISASSSHIQSKQVRKYFRIESLVEIKSSSIISTAPVLIKTISKEYIINSIGGDSMIDAGYIGDLLARHKQIILTGVPGSGKSYLVEQVSKNFDSTKIQFHPNYTYQDFIIGKTINEGSVVLEDGTLLNLLKRIKSEDKPEKPYLLILDEINRGNISSIFGEFLYALDRDKPIKLLIGNIDIILPDNLFILGTMNTADRSIALVDYAVRRRFYFVELEPDYILVDEKSTYNGKKILGAFLKKVNDNIVKHFKNRDFRLGHSYFIKAGSDWSDKDVYDNIHYRIIPMLIEYSQGDLDNVYTVMTRDIAESPSGKLFDNINKYIST